MDVLRVGRQMNLRLEQHYTPDTAAASILLCKNRITVGNEGNLFPVHAEDDHIQATVIPASGAGGERLGIGSDVLGVALDMGNGVVLQECRGVNER